MHSACQTWVSLSPNAEFLVNTIMPSFLCGCCWFKLYTCTESSLIHSTEKSPQSPQECFINRNRKAVINYKQKIFKAISKYTVWWPFSACMGPIIKCVLYIQWDSFRKKWFCPLRWLSVGEHFWVRDRCSSPLPLLVLESYLAWVCAGPVHAGTVQFMCASVLSCLIGTAFLTSSILTL